ncbi:PREDICTED: ankycorbin isoform X2 [Dinoponera quadriceps]|uniref:Ankycorbin isoform X2 n=1 Tax=Dinoponera quadriceps TaxID=609295 RepID=A0A6P3WZM5_DINQU|nr:PREDICTED: ankycorbin isoform X2 [Dinoponera quadriceps]
MDTKAPPIPLKEKPQPKRTERNDVSLPPLSGTSPGCRRPYRVLHLGATPLMHACQQGNRARVLRLLKEQEATVDYRDRTLRNALHYCMDAATGGAVAAAAPELVNAPDAEGHTPLHLAVIAGDTQLVAVLLANGADVNAKDLEGHSVLHWATVCGEAECVRLVLAAGARPSTGDLRGGSPLHYAAQCCGAAATAELAVPKKVGLRVLQTLVEFGANVNAKDEDGRQPILWAASAGSVEAVLALARAGGAAAAGTSDKDGLTALHCAASRGHARCVEALVNLCGSQPDHVDDNGCSALHYAATLGHADATALILKLGADPNRQDRKGRTPALCAAAKGQLETLKILTQHGGSLHARTVRGTGIGHEAVASGRIELIKWLAKKRPSTLDVGTQDGKTPLHVAALHGHSDACKLLLDHGARINAVLRTSKGSSMTPLDAALYRGHRDCAKLIQMHGGTTAQHLGACENKGRYPRVRSLSPILAFTAKYRTKHTVESSTASDSSSHPELYYEERWIERRTRRNLRKLARRDSRSFSEEEIRLPKTRKDQRRARSESARSNRRRKRARSTRRKREYSSVESNRRGTRRRHARKRPNGADCSSVSDDSLEVIVVKKSLEKKCEKVIRSKTPRESKRSSKLKTSNEENTMDRGEPPEEKRESTEKPPAESRITESRYDATDSTSQEIVERVVVTAMVHKDQIPDTPTSLPSRKEDVPENTKRLEEANDEGQSREKTTEDLSINVSGDFVAEKRDEKEISEEDSLHSASILEETLEDNGKFPAVQLEANQSDARDKSPDELIAKQTSESFDPAENVGLKEDEEDKEERMDVLTKRPSNSEETPSSERSSRDMKPNDEQAKIETGDRDFRYFDDSCSPKASKTRRSRPSTGRRTGRCASKKKERENSLDRSAIIAVIDSPAWNEIRKTLEDNEVVDVLPSEEEHGLAASKTSLPRVPSASRLVKIENSEEGDRPWRKQRRDSGGRDSGIEPSPRVSRIPRRRKCCPNTAKQQALNMETVTRDVQISLRRYHLERKIFFQLMELKRLQIRHGRANEHVLVKRQVDAFHKSGMTGPTLGVVKYDRPLTFRQFEAFLYEQLRRLQGKPTTPDFCTEAKQCTQKTHRCHHATSAYTSVPVYTYLAGDVPDHLPKIESRGRGQMTVEVTHGEEKQVIALPTERLDRTKRYLVTFTVKGETRNIGKRRNAKSV